MSRVRSDTQFRPYEEEILTDFKSLAMVTGHGGRSTSRKGRWIRGYLLDQERVGRIHGDYLYNIWRQWRKFITKAKALRKLDLGDGGPYQALKTYFWMLEKAGLVQKTRREKAGRGGTIPRQYYIVVRKMVNSTIWLNPYKIYS